MTSPNALSGQIIRAHRQQLGLSQSQVADGLGVRLGRNFDPSSVTRAEKGQRPISIDELFAFAFVLDMNPADLLPKPDQAERIRRLADAAANLDKLIKETTERRNEVLARAAELEAATK